MTPTNQCLDAETLAAWADGGLDPAAAALAEAHVSSCERCQEIVGLMAHTATDHEARLPAPEVPWWRRLGAGWLIPLTAGVAAVGLWMIVPTRQSASTPQTPPMLQAEAARQRDNAPAQTPAPAASAEATAETARELPAKRQEAPTGFVDQLAKNVETADLSKDKQEAKLADREVRADERPRESVTAPSPAPPAAPAAAAPAPAPAARALGRLNAQAPSREISSPDPRTRWRLPSGGGVEYSADSGATWEGVATGVTDRLTAGSSPTTDVCWIVGDNGTVLLTTDGRRWLRLAFPETMDLASVQATDSQSALVTAADGMLFQTRDGGVTWTRP